MFLNLFLEILQPWQKLLRVRVYTAKEGSGLSFYRVSRAGKSAKWIAAIQRKGWTLVSSSRLCFSNFIWETKCEDPLSPDYGLKALSFTLAQEITTLKKGHSLLPFNLCWSHSGPKFLLFVCLVLLCLPFLVLNSLSFSCPSSISVTLTTTLQYQNRTGYSPFQAFWLCWWSFVWIVDFSAFD